MKTKSHFQNALICFCLITAAALFIVRLAEIPERSAVRGWDNSFYVMWVRSVVIDHDIHFGNELEINNTLPRKGKEKDIDKLVVTETGYIPNKYGIGWGLTSLPFFVIADVIVLSLRSVGWESLPRDGYNFIYQIMLQLGQLFYALVGLFFAYRLCASFFDPYLSKLAVLSTWGCSMLVYYQSSNLSMAHSLVFSLIAICYYYSWQLWSGTGKRMTVALAVICLTSGLLVVTRYQAAVYLLFPLLAVLKSLKANPNRTIKSTLLSSLLFLLPVLLQVLAWKTIYGHYLVFTYGKAGESFLWNDAAWLKVLFSSNHGLFYWHPLLLLGCLGFLIWSVRVQRLALIWVISMLITYVVNATWWCWWLGSSFGLRNFEVVVLFCMCGMAYVLTQAKKRILLFRLAQSLIILALIWNINLVILYSVHVVARNGSVTWAEMLKATLTFYPSLVGISH